MKTREGEFRRMRERNKMEIKVKLRGIVVEIKGQRGETKGQNRANLEAIQGNFRTNLIEIEQK